MGGGGGVRVCGGGERVTVAILDSLHYLLHLRVNFIF